MSVAVTVTSDRANLEEHKTRLTTMLKDNWVSYWDLLKRYVQSKLSKQELDAQARTLLGEENVALHNQFFLGLLRNVHAAIIPKLLLVRTPKDGKRGKLGVKRTGKDGIVPMLMHSSSELCTEEDQETWLRWAAASGFRSQPSALSPVDFVLGTPELAALRGRMMKIAAEAGLTDVHNDSVHLLMNALEQHLKDLVSVCEASQPSATTNERLVTLRELLVAAQTSPYLLGEDRPLNMERLVGAEFRVPPRPVALRPPTASATASAAVPRK